MLEETPGQNQKMMVGLFIQSGLGMPKDESMIYLTHGKENLITRSEVIARAQPLQEASLRYEREHRFNQVKTQNL